MEVPNSSHRDLERHWSDFLQAASGIYHKLEQGAKGCQKSQAWFASKKDERKSDQLLQYVNQARNADHHGLGGTTLVQFSAKGDFRTQGVKSVSGPSGEFGVHPMDPTKPLEILPAKVVLKSVRNRGVTYMPPDEHLGQKIICDSPHLPDALDVARLGLAYLERMAAEAAALPVHS
jgi:hypothetical protein